MAKAKTTAKRKPKGSTKAAMDSYGIDKLCEAIMERKTLTEIAKDAGVHIYRFLEWIDADSERSARVKAARTAMAKIWDEKAEKGIAAAADPFELSKAKELAHHYRWRASKTAPREFGDKLALTGDDGGPLQVQNLSIADLDARLAAALAAASGGK